MLERKGGVDSRKYRKEAQLGVPHSEIQVELNWQRNWQVSTYNSRQSRVWQVHTTSWWGHRTEKMYTGKGDTAHIFLMEGTIIYIYIYIYIFHAISYISHVHSIYKDTLGRLSASLYPSAFLLYQLVHHPKRYLCMSPSISLLFLSLHTALHRVPECQAGQAIVTFKLLLNVFSKLSHSSS